MRCFDAKRSSGSSIGMNHSQSARTYRRHRPSSLSLLSGASSSRRFRNRTLERRTAAGAEVEEVPRFDAHQVAHDDPRLAGGSSSRSAGPQRGSGRSGRRDGCARPPAPRSRTYSCRRSVLCNSAEVSATRSSHGFAAYSASGVRLKLRQAGSPSGAASSTCGSKSSS